VAQNYRVLISQDGQDYRIVQDWILAGNTWGQIEKENMTYIIIDTLKFAAGAHELYVKIDNAGGDHQGWGGAIYGFTVYYANQQ
jgi:hypothetical protein